MTNTSRPATRTANTDKIDILLKDFKKFLSFASISNDNKPEHQEQGKQAVKFLAQLFENMQYTGVHGATTPKIYYVQKQTSNSISKPKYQLLDKTRLKDDPKDLQPWGTLLALFEFDPKKPWIIVYGHYDVQSVDLNAWHGQNPFEPKIIGDIVIARGASDNKGRIWASIVAINHLLEQLKQNNHRQTPQYNIAFMIEGEEERTGKTVFAATDMLLELLGPNANIAWAYVNDQTWLTDEKPSVIYSLRGAVMFELTLKTAQHPLHSGTYGNVVLNAGNLAGYIVFKLKDILRNRLRIDRLNRLVRTPSKHELEYLEKVSPTWEELKQISGAFCVTKYRQKGKTWAPLQLTGLRPSLDVNGLVAGNIVHGATVTIIPDTARIKFSIRTVPYMTVEKTTLLVKSYVQKLLKKFKGVKYELTVIASAEYTYLDRQHPVIQKTYKAMQKAFGKAYIVPSGSTVPIVGYLASKKIPVSIPALGKPSDRVHAPFEQFELSRIHKGATVLLEMMEG